MIYLNSNIMLNFSLRAYHDETLCSGVSAGSQVIASSKAINLPLFSINHILIHFCASRRAAKQWQRRKKNRRPKKMKKGKLKVVISES